MQRHPMRRAPRKRGNPSPDIIGYGDQGPRSAAQSATNHRLELRGIAVALDLDRSSCAIDLGEIGSGQLDGRCADIPLQAMELRSAWDRDDPRRRNGPLARDVDHHAGRRRSTKPATIARPHRSTRPSVLSAIRSGLGVVLKTPVAFVMHAPTSGRPPRTSLYPSARERSVEEFCSRQGIRSRLTSLMSSISRCASSADSGRLL